MRRRRLPFREVFKLFVFMQSAHVFIKKKAECRWEASLFCIPRFSNTALLFTCLRISKQLVEHRRGKKKESLLTTTTDEKKNLLIFVLLKHSRLLICRHFKVLGRKNHMLSFFRLTSVKCCRLTSYTSTQKSLTPSAEFQSETKIHWKKKIFNGS